MIFRQGHAPADDARDAFALRNGRSALVCAYLLCGDWQEAEDVAAPAVESAAAAKTVAGREEGAVDASVARAFARPRRVGWGLGGGLQLRDRDSHPAAAVDDPRGLWPALSQLTEVERAVVVLRDHTGLGPAEIAAALRLPEAEVAGHAKVADGLLRQHARLRPEDEGDVRAPLATFFADHRELAPPTAGLVARGARVRRNRRLRMAAAATAVLAAGTAGIVVSDRSQPTADGPPATSHEQSSPAPVHSSAPVTDAPPEVGPGMKLVGFETVMVEVPASWAQGSGSCRSLSRNSVVFVRDHGPLCGDANLPRGLSAVSFGEDTAGEPETQGDFGPRRSVSGQFVVTAPSRHGGRYVAYSAAPGLRVGVTVTAPSLRQLKEIMGSVAVIPPGYTTVPRCVGLSARRVDRVVYAAGLIPQRLADPSSISLPLRVVRQSQPEGAVLALQTRIVLGMLPR